MRQVAIQKLNRVPASFLSDHKNGGLFLLYGHPAVSRLAQELLARPLSDGHGVMVLDAGNLFDPYLISRMARSLGRGAGEFLSRVVVSRSFTCHQTLALVRQAAGLQEKSFSIVLVLGCLTTFYDEAIPLGERMALCKKTLALLREISRKGRRVLATAAEAPPGVQGGFDSLLIHATDRAVRCDLDEGGSYSMSLIRG